MQVISCQASERGHGLQAPGRCARSLTAKLQYSGSSVTVVSSGSVVVLGSTNGQLRASWSSILSKLLLQRGVHAWSSTAVTATCSAVFQCTGQAPAHRSWPLIQGRPLTAGQGVQSPETHLGAQSRHWGCTAEQT